MDERLANKNSSDRNTKAERESAETVMATTNERRKMFREFTQEALPTPPAMPGWHFCWLSTTNQYDPIYKRMRMGYQPVKPDDSEALKEFEHLRLKSGEFEGCISVNEMVLFKIPQEVYQEIMEVVHYEMPLEEEERIKANAANVPGIQNKDSQGRPLNIVEGDGFENIVHRVKRPQF